MTNYILLIFGFIFSFFALGFVVVEVFFSKLPMRLKFPLYFLISILVSSYLIYSVSLIFGFTKNTVLTVFILLSPLFFYKFFRIKNELILYVKDNLKALTLCFFVFVIYIVALYPAILSLKDGYYVMSGSNWQDTAMHMSITQSLTQGNFPPQAPYYSGHPLTYYYFSDFHSSIIAILSDRFEPKIFVFSNAILASLLCLSIYTFALLLIKNKKSATTSAFLGTFFSSYLSVKFIDSLIAGEKAVDLLSNKSYSMEYNQLFGMANMADYYLQNRPMMVGISAFVIFISLLIYFTKEKNLKVILLGGFIVAMLVKFQFFTVVACCITFLFMLFVEFKKDGISLLVKKTIAFFLPVLLFYILFGLKAVNGQSLIELFDNNFRFGPWDLDRSYFWHILFLFSNLGMPFLLTFIYLFKKDNSYVKKASLLSVVFVTIPYIVLLTPAKEDMFKFFYFAVVIMSVVSVYLLKKYKILLAVMILTSTLSSFLTLANSYLNKNLGYTDGDYNAGVWVRENTTKNSIFLTKPTVHSGPSDIGGRPRIMSYANWPYTHGFGVGEDNIFVRDKDILDAYETGDVSLVKQKYNAKYVYLGPDEQGEFPEAVDKFDKNDTLVRIYDKDGIIIYEIL